jgi:hypothetical protein
MRQAVYLYEATCARHYGPDCLLKGPAQPVQAMRSELQFLFLAAYDPLRIRVCWSQIESSTVALTVTAHVQQHALHTSFATCPNSLSA